MIKLYGIIRQSTGTVTSVHFNGTKTLAIMILRITKFRITTLYITTPSIMTLDLTTLSITTLYITTPNIMTLYIITASITTKRSTLQHSAI